MDLSIQLITTNELKSVNWVELNKIKSLGYDLIINKVHKELPSKSLILLTLIFNTNLRLEYFPTQCKVS